MRPALLGKWHLGLGDGTIDWNGEIKPGPLNGGLTTVSSSRPPAIACRVSTSKTIASSGSIAKTPSTSATVARSATGRPEKGDPTCSSFIRSFHGHDQTIVNGISRIGYLTGGKSALWVDEDMADVLTRKATSFTEAHASGPFFLYLATHDIHVPRVSHARSAGNPAWGQQVGMRSCSSTGV